MRRLLPILLIGAGLAIAVWLLTRPGTPVDSSRLVVVAIPNDIPSLDPARLQDAFALRAGYLIGDGLAKLNAENEIVPAIAESWESNDDFTRWTFSIRENAYFHPHPTDGGDPLPVTAQGVVSSFERMLSPDTVTAGPLAGVLAGAKEFQDGDSGSIGGIRIVSPSVVEFNLSRPDSLFPGRISSPAYAIVNKAAADAEGSEFGQSSHCSTGPYRFVERRGNDVVLQRFEGYWGGFGSDPPEQIVLRTIKEDALALAEARSGRVSIAYASPAMLEGITTGDGQTIELIPEAANSFQALTVPIFNTYFLAFNDSKVHPDLRRAILHAIDRDEVIAAAVPSTGVPAAGPIPLACSGYQSAVAPKRDLALARAALATYQEKLSIGAPKLTILVHELAQAVPTGEVIQSQLAEIGIEVELVQRNFNAVLDSIRKGDFEATVLGFEYQYSEPQLILENFYTSASVPLPNVFHYKNPETDSAIAALLQRPHSPDSLRAAATVEQSIVADAPGVFLYQTAQTLLISPDLSGVRANGSNYLDLTRASWQ